MTTEESQFNHVQSLETPEEMANEIEYFKAMIEDTKDKPDFNKSDDRYVNRCLFYIQYLENKLKNLKINVLLQLNSGIHEIKFVKVDGSTRVMACTRNFDIIKNDIAYKESANKSEKVDPLLLDAINVYEINKGFRAFKFSKLIEIN